MTYSEFRKALKQLKGKPSKFKKFIKHNSPKERRTGQNRLRCRRCARSGAFIGKYGLNLCRQCFREIATKIGFKKFH